MKGIGVPLSSIAKKYPLKSLMYGVGAVAVLSSVIGNFLYEFLGPNLI
ncbi:MAG: hypothetical protein ACFFAQ_05295 [Promethearchaeota archaeon]